MTMLEQLRAALALPKAASLSEVRATLDRVLAEEMTPEERAKAEDEAKRKKDDEEAATAKALQEADARTKAAGQQEQQMHELAQALGLKAGPRPPS